MHKSLQKAGITDVTKHITNVLKAAKAQLQKNLTPVSSLNASSWNPPKPSQTDYRQPCNPQCLGTDVKLVDLSFDTINWDMINWNFLSVFDKAEIQRRKMIREL